MDSLVFGEETLLGSVSMSTHEAVSAGIRALCIRHQSQKMASPSDIFGGEKVLIACSLSAAVCEASISEIYCINFGIVLERILLVPWQLAAISSTVSFVVTRDVFGFFPSCCGW